LQDLRERTTSTSPSTSSSNSQATDDGRVDKPSFPHDEAMAPNWSCKGSHFDVDVVDAFQELAGRFKAIAGQFRD
jgi:HD-GYP domain-containing protein (c-di-GMP phosphodiesterase class II)